MNKFDFKVMKYAIIGVMALFCLLGGCTCCTSVDSSEVGIKFKKFSVSDQGELIAENCSGYVLYNPLTTDVFTYPTFVQRKDYEPFTVTTKDAAIFTMDPLLAYQLRKDMAVQVFSKYRRDLGEIENGYMKTVISDAYRLTANKYTSDELMANRAEFEAGVRALLEKSLGAEGFIVHEFTSQITPPAALQAAIDSKNKSIQESLKAENEVKKAEANAKIAIAQAEGNAKAMKIKADAEAYYNRTIAASLSPMIVQEDWIEKWDGKLPTYSGGGNGSNLIQIPVK